jgi:hypothetical protein
MSDEARKRIAAAAAEREAEARRTKYGSRISGVVANTLLRSVSFVPAVPSTVGLLSLNREAASWSRLRTTRLAVEQLLGCLAPLLGPASLVLDEYRYMGALALREEELGRAAALAEALNDSLACQFPDHEGGVVVDYYDDACLPPEEHFSLLIFGDELAALAAPCLSD